MNLKSKKYPNIKYEKGQEIFLSPEEMNSHFYFDVEEELTSNNEAMNIVAEMLDEVEMLEKTAKNFLKKILDDKKNEYYDVVLYFMEFHRDEIDSDVTVELFQVDNPSDLSFVEMVDLLKIKRLGGLIDSESQQQIFIVDLSFNTDFTDELIVIYFNLEKQIFYVTHES